MLRRVLAIDAAGALDEELVLHRPGWAVMQARPDNRAGQVLFSDLLDALGKRSMSSYRGRAANHSEAIAFAWLAAGPTEHLVVRGSHLLGPKNLRRLCTLTTACGVTTWLLDELHVNDGHGMARYGLVTSDSNVAGFLAARALSPTTKLEDAPRSFAAVPDVHFLSFLTAARELLPPEDFDTLLPGYRHALTTTRDWLLATEDATEEAFARHLHDLTAHTPDLNLLTVLARGAQAGAFVAGWHARVDVNRFAHRGASQVLPVTLRPEDWRALDALLRPADAATCVLAALGVTVNDIATITPVQVSDDGNVVTINGEASEVPAEGRHLLVAQHVHRNLVQPESAHFLAAGTKDPAVTPKRVGALLYTVARDTGVVLRARNTARSASKESRWTHRLGVSLTRL
ncbi:MAG: hypothetical protein ACXVRV_05185, partial [Gaiellaceae bacterium]